MCNTVSAILEKDPDDVVQLTNSKTETMALEVEHEVLPLTGTRSGRLYIKDYGNADVGPSKLSEEANEKSTKQF